MADLILYMDRTILFYIQNHMKSPAMDQAMVFITSLGNAGLLWIIFAFLFLFYKKYQKCGIYLTLSLFFTTYLCENLLKPMFGRIRPCHLYPEIDMLLPRPHSPSFPSGHTMVGFAAATVIFYFNRKLGITAYIIAALIAFSRLYLFVHYPTDILGGVIFGILTSCLFIRGINQMDQWK